VGWVAELGLDNVIFYLNVRVVVDNFDNFYDLLCFFVQTRWLSLLENKLT
jgi:hypothetical protein